jgi:thiol-disulfide isomerase/thioredoxin
VSRPVLAPLTSTSTRVPAGVPSRWLATVLAVLVGCLVAGCSTTPASRASAPASGRHVAQPHVDVDTPALRALRHRAGIAPCPAARARPPARDALPDVRLPCLGGGRSVRLSGLRGPMVINLFAQWCGPCRVELPHYQRLHERMGAKVAVLGLDYLDTQPGGALQLARDSGVTYPLVADPDGAVRAAFRARGLPGIVLVDGHGRVVDVEYRVVTSYAQLRDLVRRRLGV